MKLNNQIIIAVSGGPDSMFLLQKYKSRNPIVAFVNYNQREDSFKDQEIVQNYCHKYNLILEQLILKKEDYQDGNFQKWAREKRYDFFVSLWKKYHTNILLTAHHKDDFLETCLMQEQKHKIINYWGIKKYSNFKNLRIYRPLVLKIFKSEIIKYNHKNNIKYAKDWTNSTNKYKRNQIRMYLEGKSQLQKNLLITKYRIKNLFLRFKNFKVNKQINYWKSNNYSQETFINLKNQNQVLYFLLHNHFENLNLSKEKINSIIQFINSNNRTSVYKLAKNTFLKKQKGKVLFY
ncbi:tRNA lysidine(34) synthetase TilS [Mycoplasmopsis citelli]|uniref:tRNA lysidine(34) synthetase TilS n=1 Tax=Mycoplasmopsis citelli TaxID=171281 RepID=UPI002113EC7A|nr:tRNA lysidine(34) synthetase TilS [Mycoplasmopsis citelli]UUD36219.1 tRNA lysidine(34) synthetase TilS [Mycoplasmopsis citelli]